MKKLFTLALVLGALMLTSCAAHFYHNQNSSMSKTDVVLSKRNFAVVGQAEGSATATFILGIGGLSKRLFAQMLSQRCSRTQILRARRPLQISMLSRL